MLLDAKYKETLIPALLCYANSPDDFPVRSGIIETSEGDSFTYGLSPKDATSLVEQLSLNNLMIDDSFLNEMFFVVLTYKETVNSVVHDSLVDLSERASAKREISSLNALIRHIKAYCLGNNIELDDYELE